MPKFKINLCEWVDIIGCLKYFFVCDEFFNMIAFKNYNKKFLSASQTNSIVIGQNQQPIKNVKYITPPSEYVALYTHLWWCGSMKNGGKNGTKPMHSLRGVALTSSSRSDNGANSQGTQSANQQAEVPKLKVDKHMAKINKLDENVLVSDRFLRKFSGFKRSFTVLESNNKLGKVSSAF